MLSLLPATSKSATVLSEPGFGADCPAPYHWAILVHYVGEILMSLHELNTLPGVTADPEAATRQFVFNHTMLRVKDITRSLDFYTRVLGFSLVEKRDFPEAEFSLYFLALVDKTQIPEDDAARGQWMKSIPGILELTHNHGTESDATASYHNGNSDPRGFGHICVSVPDVKVACERFETLGVDFQKRLSDGRMNSLAFIKDPDGYWVEIIQPTPL
ncbi:Lactoylglutathione lyase [Pseudomonas coronafaciens pv. zizaniae]|nr:Lactoylglutathione lyase [Pseudomonas coronafaciens pv. zizaniae]RMS35873.1 Lactoylglutathione lyase [Pseudomonas coronafaciens pv. garcae]RMS93311.1 Lactoylglutathione lyase [Pseudomonas coronafaciens pv. oryzae]RMU82361.1 Lactoylglutathione lyase [Pseudomonas coronafaciens pv. porri]RMO03018.1 Lactoylglutathione lyase [Pseudomonas coronafaciens pv. zizaniae]